MNGIESPENMDSFNDHANTLAKLIYSSLPAYPPSRLPKEKGSLQLGQHWVWDYFSKKLIQLAAMMILSKHVPTLERLKKYQFGECLLEDSSFFPHATGDLVDKTYRNIVQLSDLLYAVSINLKENISSNPGCEWQLESFIIY
jgi:hypothetical protein